MSGMHLISIPNYKYTTSLWLPSKVTRDLLLPSTHSVGVFNEHEHGSIRIEVYLVAHFASCGLFSISLACAIAHNHRPTAIKHKTSTPTWKHHMVTRQLASCQIKSSESSPKTAIVPPPWTWPMNGYCVFPTDGTCTRDQAESLMKTSLDRVKLPSQSNQLVKSIEQTGE